MVVFDFTVPTSEISPRGSDWCRHVGLDGTYVVEAPDRLDRDLTREWSVDAPCGRRR
jgi:hypothetical protein